MRAVVLSGGGGKGAYQAGCYKAIKKLRIKYDIVTGTSIGALNGALMVQGELKKCLKLWKNANFGQIFDDYEGFEKTKDMYGKYFDEAIHGGISDEKIERLVDSFYNPRKMYKSKVKYGVVTFNLSKMKPVFATKENMKPFQLKKYITASAVCFPVFKPSKIDDDSFVDGGYYDNTPINLAVELGADEVIAIDLRAIGFKQKTAGKNVKLTQITPNNKLASFLVFDKVEAKKMMKYGYNDTMKAFKKLDGRKFTYKKDHLLKNYNKHGQNLVTLTRYYINQDKSILKLFTKLNDVEHIMNKQNVMKIMNNTLENLGLCFNLDETLIYDVRLYNRLLLRQLDQTPLVKIKGNNPKEIIRGINQATLVKFIYANLNEKISRATYDIICLFPKEFLMAVYLKCLNR